MRVLLIYLAELIDESKWGWICVAVCGGSDERQFHSPDEVYEKVGMGKHLAHVDDFRAGSLPGGPNLADRPLAAAGLRNDRRWPRIACRIVWLGLGHFTGVPGIGCGMGSAWRCRSR